MSEFTYRGTRLIALNDRGNPIGEDHPRAKLTNAEVELIHELANPTDGAKPLSQREIARKFEISRGTVGDIMSFRRRAVYAVGWRRVQVTLGGRPLAGPSSPPKGDAASTLHPKK
jgi:hypothetical protein